MSTTTVETMPRPIPTTTTTRRGADSAHSNRRSSLCIKDLLINDLADGAAASGSTDDGFYSADLFDSVDEEAFIQAQRDAFTAINDAALARAIQESEILAAKKAAEENRRRMVNASATGRASRASSSATPTAPPTAHHSAANVGPYALVSPSELGQSSSRPRRASTAQVPPVAPASSSRSPPSSAPLPAKSSSPSRSQYPSTSTSSPLSLSSSSSASPPSRINPATSSYRPSTLDRQQSTRYYSTAQNSSRAPPAMASQSQPKFVTPTPSVPATMTRTTTTSTGQAVPNHSSSSSTTNISTFYSSNISAATSASAKAASSLPSGNYHQRQPSSSSPSNSRSAVPAPSNARPTPATWQPPTIPTPSIPRSKEIPIPMPIAPRSGGLGGAMSASASARDLRLGVMASGSPKANNGPIAAMSRPGGATTTKSSATPTPSASGVQRQRGSSSSGSQPTPIPAGRGRRTVRGQVSPGPQAKWVRAKGFLDRTFGRGCRKCGSGVEGSSGSAPIPTEPFSHNLLRHLHVTCSNPDCRATYCRACFSSVDGLCQPTGESPSTSASGSPSSSASSSPSPSRKGSFSAPSSTTPGPNVIPGVTTCQGSRGCDIKSCCPFASIIAISTILDAFDMEYTRAAYAAGFGSPASFVEEAQAFVEVVIARSSSPSGAGAGNTKVFEGVVIRTLYAVSSWLVVFQERREEEEEETDERPPGPDPVQHLLYPLISRSLLPSLMHAFLQNRNVGDWLRHSEIYVLILEVLRKLVDSGLGRVLDEPIVTSDSDDSDVNHGDRERRWRSRRTRGSSGSPETSASESSCSSSGEEGLYSSEEERDTETDETSPAEDSDSDSCSDDDDSDTEDEDEKRKTWHASDSDIASTPTQTVASSNPFAAAATNRGRRGGNALDVTRMSIKALVTKLEEHRGPLMAFGATVKFPATKAKVHTLCDGISYLLLQQVFAAD